MAKNTVVQDRHTKITRQ